ncbi:hypothetical protein SLA2020_448770 [Shorea laevis]
MTTRITTRSVTMAKQKKTPIQNPSSSSKIPFPPRKIRKLTANTRKPLKPAKQTTDSANPSQPTIVFPIAVKPLTFEGEIDAALTHLRSSDPLLTALIDSYRPPAFEPQCRRS